MVNALEASRSLDHHSSAAYRDDLAVAGDPVEVLRFSSSLCSAEFRDLLADDTDALLAAAGLGTYGETIERSGLLECDDYVLSPEEEEMFLEIRDRLQESGVLGQEAFEQQLAAEGYGLPAILVVIVAIAAVVAVVVAIAAK